MDFPNGIEVTEIAPGTEVFLPQIGDSAKGNSRYMEADR
jgi:hypothetical protein